MEAGILRDHPIETPLRGRPRGFSPRFQELLGLFGTDPERKSQSSVSGFAARVRRSWITSAGGSPLGKYMLIQLLTTLMLSSAAVAQGNPTQERSDPTDRLLKALPSEAIGVLATAGWDDIRLRCAQNAWAEFAKKGSWAGFDSIVDKVLEETAGSLAKHIELGGVLASIQGPLAMSVSREEYGWEACGLVDAGERAEAFDALFQMVWGQLEENEDGSSTYDYEGSPILFVGGSGGDTHLAIFQSKGIFGALLHEDSDSVLPRVIEVVDRLAGNADGKGFLGTRAFHEARKSHNGTPALRIVFNGDSFFEALTRELNAGQLGRPTEMGIFDIGWAYVNMDLGPSESLDFNGGVSIPADTLLCDFADLLGPIPTHLIARMPATSSNVSLWNYDLNGAWQLLLDTLGTYDAEAFETIRTGLTQVRDTWDIDIDEELFAQFTGNFASFTMPVPEGEIAKNLKVLGIDSTDSPNESNAFMIELEDAYIVEDALEKAFMASGIGSLIEEAEYKGHFFNSASLGFQSFMWGFTDDTFVYSNTPTPVHTALSLSKLKKVELPHLDLFKKVLKRSGPNVNLITISDTRSTVETVISALSLAERFVPMVGVDPILREMLSMGFPDPTLAASYFQGTLVQTISRQKDGVYFTFAAR